MSQPRKRLGDLLVEVDVITEDQLMQALAEQKKSKLRLGDQLAAMGFLDEQKLIEVLDVQLGIPHVNLARRKIDQSLLNMITEDMAKRYQILPLQKEGHILKVAMSDPLDYYAIDDLRLSTGFQIEPAIAKKEEMKMAINRYYGMQKSINQMMQDIPEDELKKEKDTDNRERDDSATAKMVNEIINQAVKVYASDIHIEPFEQETKIRFRVDGVLRTERQLPKAMQPLLTSRIKILAGMDISEKRMPQDGRFHKMVDDRKIDLRVSIIPTIYGEKVVMRILDSSISITNTAQLGLSEENLQVFKQIIHRPYGIILVTGPTGSGKTMTLYAALQELNIDEVNITTVEDPVEYQLSGVNQIQINPNIGLTFAKGLRSILRQDPNILMVGEIRDRETADIAMRAAMTGHLVLSTLHTNDAISSVSRLIDMGIEPFLVASSLVGVVGQRLVRKVCSQCAQTHTLNEEEKELLVSRGLSIEQVVKGVGCYACQSTGYKGRMAIFEVLPIDLTLRDLVTRRSPAEDYRNYLQEKSYKTMFEHGLSKVAEGKTTIDEVFRVTVDQSEE